MGRVELSVIVVLPQSRLIGTPSIRIGSFMATAYCDSVIVIGEGPRGRTSACMFRSRDRISIFVVPFWFFSSLAVEERVCVLLIWFCLSHALSPLLFFGSHSFCFLVRLFLAAIPERAIDVAEIVDVVVIGTETDPFSMFF